MIKRILLFLTIIGLSLAFYFYQSGFPKSLPASSQGGQVFNSQNNPNQIIEKEVSLPTPLKVAGEWLVADKNSIVLTIDGVFKYTNSQRLKESLSSLSLNEKLNIAAKIKLEDMFNEQYFEHTAPDGTTMDDLANQAGYDYILIGENLAQGNFKDDQALVSAWMASPKHRANILNGRFTEIGVAVGRGWINGVEVWLAISHFGRPADLCPDIDQGLASTIDQNKTRLDYLSQELNLNNGGAAVFLSFIRNFNKVREYNKLVEETKLQINLYNQQVTDFNNCIQN